MVRPGFAGQRVAGAVGAVAANLRKGIGQADKLGDEGTADLLTGVSREMDKQLWLLEAHLQADR